VVALVAFPALSRPVVVFCLVVLLLLLLLLLLYCFVFIVGVIV